MSIKINDDNLRFRDIQEYSSKVRAFLVEDDRVLLAKYGDIYLLPGGSIEEEEVAEEAILRELHEETGKYYSLEELKFLKTIYYFQKDYPKRDGKTENRLLKTRFFVGPYKGINPEQLFLTEQEQNEGFSLLLVPIAELEELVLNNKTDNPRNPFFVKELLTILEEYKKDKAKKLTKKPQKKNL